MEDTWCALAVLAGGPVPTSDTPENTIGETCMLDHTADRREGQQVFLVLFGQHLIELLPGTQGQDFGALLLGENEVVLELDQGDEPGEEIVLPLEEIAVVNRYVFIVGGGAVKSFAEQAADAL